MFGYVRINKQELLVKDYESYRAVYCGLCKTLGKKYTLLSRMSLNYDYTFYAVVMLALAEMPPKFATQGCLFNPLARKKCCKSCPSLNKAADALIMTTYFKLNDSVADSGFVKGLFYRFLRLFYKPMVKKAKKKEPQIYGLLEDYMSRQAEVEQKQNVLLDEAAEPTAFFMSRLMSESFDDSPNKRVMELVGYNVGKWIYIMDALDDLKDDIKHKSFNPLVNMYPRNIAENSFDAIYDDTDRVLNSCIAEAAKAVDLLTPNRFQMIIKNVIYIGMPTEQHRILNRTEKAGKKDESI